jgi:hypothetical protein
MARNHRSDLNRTSGRVAATNPQDAVGRRGGRARRPKSPTCRTARIGVPNR